MKGTLSSSSSCIVATISEELGSLSDIQRIWIGRPVLCWYTQRMRTSEHSSPCPMIAGEVRKVSCAAKLNPALDKDVCPFHGSKTGMIRVEEALLRVFPADTGKQIVVICQVRLRVEDVRVASLIPYRAQGETT